MRINTSLRFLAIVSALLSTEAALAHNSFSTVQDLVAIDTSKNQRSDVNRLANPAPLNAQAPETDKDISTVRNVFPSERVTPIATVVAANATAPVKNGIPQFGYDDDRGVPHPVQSLPNRNLSSLSTQTSAFSSDVLNRDRHFKISGVPTTEQSEPSVVIPVPPPRTQVFRQVKPVTQLPRVIKINSIPIVTAIPTVRTRTTISPTSNATAFTPSVPSNNITPNVATNNITPNVGSESKAELIYPLMSIAPITSGFGWRTHPLTGLRRFHSGVDLGAPSGTPIVAASTGTVVSAGWKGGYGKAIVIQHNNMQQTLYGHLSEISVQEGQTIEQGTVIGLVGSTGNSTGPHLHFESRVPNADTWVAVDPSQEVQYAADNLRRSMPYARQDAPQGL
jgi:murein DD-endopeptidase MepM/ murein hydrolase activator NlpD